jgi:hypothetical protein
MLEDADLDAAVAEGVLTQDRADALRAFAARRRGTEAAEIADEERFRFMRGFNDFFFAIGILLLGFGLGYFAGDGALQNLVAAAVMWGLSELLVRRMRLVLPGILLACFFVVFVYDSIPLDLWLFPPAPISAGAVTGKLTPLLFGAQMFRFAAPMAIAAKALVAGAAAALFYVRFRLPFALLPVAGSLVLAVAALASSTVSATWGFSAVLLLCGLAVFAVAMAFDLSDRERATRRADCAFWLHLLAAPLIVHSLIGFLTSRSPAAAAAMTAEVAAAILAVVALLTLVAIIIDRRALLVSTLSYLGIVVARAIMTAAGNDNTKVFFMTLVVLGCLVLALGVGWAPLRRRLMAILPGRLADRLPHVVPA